MPKTSYIGTAGTRAADTITASLNIGDVVAVEYLPLPGSTEGRTVWEDAASSTRMTLTLTNRLAKRAGNFLGVNRVGYKVSAEISVPGADTTSLVSAAMINTDIAIPVGCDPDIVDEIIWRCFGEILDRVARTRLLEKGVHHANCA